MNRLGVGLRDALEKLDELLGRLLFQQAHGVGDRHWTPPPMPPWTEMVDNQSDVMPGRSYFTSSDVARARRHWLEDRIYRSQDLMERFFVKPARKNEPPKVRTEAFAGYVAQAEAFLERLVPLMHITGGQPSRITELYSIRHANSREGGLRNILVGPDGMYYSPRLTKDFARKGKYRTSYHLLPDEVGRPLWQYLMYVVSFIDIVGARSFTDYVRSPFLCGQLTTPSDDAAANPLRPLGREEEEEEEAEDGGAVELDEASERAADEREEAVLRSFEAEEASGTASDLDEAENDPTRGPSMTLRRLYKALNTVLRLVTGQPLTSREWRHLSPFLARFFIQQSGAAALLASLAVSKDIEEMISRQCGHSVSVALHRYGGSLTASPFVTRIRQEQMVLSLAWHEILGVPSAIKRLVECRYDASPLPLPLPCRPVPAIAF